MGYWIITDQNGQYVMETDTYEQALDAIDASSYSYLSVVPYYEFYGLV